ncbi:hypothetical protein GCM10007304_49370 [Rhodococcoides trifolii]|uniref:GAF domain-containing protein n=1 Tax=Rhodococcoides trifolii TaxID=908250 RepID=A0A917LJ50_9NOCA|nr:GAF domain-containing protein [Rhodococcus trifolii]GGG29670.1 hypothetical protein GCM10007304_49370 [Rhodococcus trifolii]
MDTQQFTVATDRPEIRRWMRSVGAITRTVVAAAPLHDVLDLIARTAADLMGYEFCGVLLPDPERRKLIIEGSSGLSTEYVARVNADRPVRLDQDAAVEAPSSTAFRTGRPVAIADIDATPQFAPWGGVAKEQGYRAMISVPLVESNDVVIGTLNCYRKGTYSFEPEEISLLTVLADHAALALTTARLRSDEAVRMDELVILNGELHQQRDLLQRSEEIHRKLTEIALRGGGVPGIATALSILVSRPISIEDTNGSTLGRSTGHFAVSVDEGDVEYPWHPVLLSENEVARIRVHAGGTPLSSIDTRAIEHAAVVTSLEILRSRTADEAAWRLHGEVLNDLVGGEPSALATVVERAQRLGHDLTVDHTMVVVALSDVRPDDVDLCQQQAVRRIHAWAGAQEPKPLSGIHHDRIVVLIPDMGPDTAEHVRRLVASNRPPAVSTAVIAGPCSDLPSYNRAYRAASGALDMLVLTGRADESVSLDGLGLVGLLLQLDDTTQLLRYADRVLGPVRAHDVTRGTDLILTLRTHFAGGLVAGTTATRLHVHPNTVGQRLRRIHSLTGMDLTRPDEAMEIAVALTVGDVANSYREAR